MKRFGLILTIALLAGCGPTAERWQGQLDNCNNGSNLENRDILLYLVFDGSSEPDGWIGVAESDNADETFDITDLDDVSYDGVDLDFDADFGTINTSSNLERDGDRMSGDVDIDYPIFGSDNCDVDLDLS
jgi:hypothetical protein